MIEPYFPLKSVFFPGFEKWFRSEHIALGVIQLIFCIWFTVEYIIQPKFDISVQFYLNLMTRVFFFDL